MISITLTKARENLSLAGVSHATAALLVGLRPSTLTAAFREACRLDSPKEAELHAVSTRLIELRESLSPLRMPEDSTTLQRLVDGLTQGRLTPDGIREMVSRLVEGE